MEEAWRRKLGLETFGEDGRAMIDKLETLLRESGGVDWTIFWRGLAELAKIPPAEGSPRPVVELVNHLRRKAFYAQPAAPVLARSDSWPSSWRARLAL